MSVADQLRARLANDQQPAPEAQNIPANPAAVAPVPEVAAAPAPAPVPAPQAAPAPVPAPEPAPAPEVLTGQQTADAAYEQSMLQEGAPAPVPIQQALAANVAPIADVSSAVGQRAGLTVSRMYSESGTLKSEEADEEVIQIAVPSQNVPLATVGCTANMTINMGSYESVKLGVSITLPCYVEEIDGAYKYAKKLVDLRLNKEVQDIKTYRAQKQATEGQA